ncbi:prealbumin-like fold domain-containing protein, partial [Bifidobacterium miconisargentati]|uniref:prealbumin-like fold domain-containing protein n=1 Tax=Bifidobacterium miconisargentati TaxID=2834437 RepID=UPI001BDDB9FC
IRRLLVACLSWSKTSYPGSALLLLPQRLNDEPTPTKTTQAPVLFSTPYTASWSKDASKTDENGVAVPDESKPLSGSQWQIVSTGTATVEGTDEAAVYQVEAQAKKNAGGPFEEDFYPTICAVKNDENGTSQYEGYSDGKCWKEVVEISAEKGVTTATVTRSAIVIDNIANDKEVSNTYSYSGFDNNPDGGGFDINNLGNGTYTMTEYRAPTGYEPEVDSDGNVKEYTFTVDNAQARWDNGTDDDGNAVTTVDKHIGNSPLKGVSWGKVDADTNQPLSDSEWTVTEYKEDGTTLDEKSSREVRDCVVVTDKDVNCASIPNGNSYYVDRDSSVGKFNINGLKPGKYQLKESVAPDGYWDPEAENVYIFTIPEKLESDTDGSVVLYKADGTTPVSQNNGAANVINTLPQISWKKVDAESGLVLDSEETEWSLVGPVAVDSNGKLVNTDVKTVKASITDCHTESGATEPCSGQSTGLQTSGEGDDLKHWYNDLADGMGYLKVSGLQRPTADQDQKGIRYRYTLKETKAPSGYVKSDKEYVFTIGATQSTSLLDLNESCIKDVGGVNCIPNSKPVGDLPLTGGDARSWILAGSAFAAAAGLATALTNEYRRRKGLNM